MHPRRLPRALIPLALLCGCSGDSTGAGTEGGDATTATATATATATTGSASGTSTTPDATVTATGTDSGSSSSSGDASSTTSGTEGSTSVGETSTGTTEATGTTGTTSTTDDSAGEFCPELDEPECGDGVVETPEMCEPDEEGCQADCTYPSGHIFWTNTLTGIGPSAIAWAVAFDGDDAPFASIARGGAVSEGAGAWVKKYDRDGAELWYERWHTPQWTLVNAYSLAARADGSLVFAGQFHDQQTGNDGFAGELGADGAIGWGLQLPLEHSNWLEDVVALADGSVVAVGGASQDPELEDRAWIVKLTAAGEQAWAHEFHVEGGTEESALREVSALPDGRVVTFGCCVEPDTFLLRAYEPDGAEAWTTPLPKLHHAAFMSGGMATEPCGDIVTSWVTEDDTLWMSKHSMTGEELWSKTFDEPELGDVYPRALVATPQHKYVLAGLKNANNGDIFYAVLDADGELLWSETVGGDQGDQLWNAAVDRRGVVLLGGQRHDDEIVGWVRMFAP